jgi:hypothetical protein
MKTLTPAGAMTTVPRQRLPEPAPLDLPVPPPGTGWPTPRSGLYRSQSRPAMGVA